MRHAAKTDGPHASVRDGLRACGCQVWDCSKYGGGFPDLLVSHRGRLWLLEVKNPERSKGRRELRGQQADFYAKFSEHTRIVMSLDDALAVLGLVGSAA
jgi:hypothetical protein